MCHRTLAEIKAMERQDMLDLLGIPLTTMRVKCAMLALRTLEKSIHLYESAATDPRREPCPLGRYQRLTYTRR